MSQFPQPSQCNFTKEQLMILIRLFDRKRQFTPDERTLLAYLRYQEQKF